MEAKHGPWYFKQNEDGIFVKLNEERVKNSKASLMEQVLDVKESASRGRESDHVVVSLFILFRSLRVVSAPHNCLKPRPGI